MKKYVTASLFIFWALTVAILVAGLIAVNKNNNQAVTGLNNGIVNQINTTDKTANKTALNLTMAELAKHSGAQSCWLLISGKIYDVTSFIGRHPGGAREILNNCGTDATIAFMTRGGTGAHSASAVAMLNLYYIGNLNQTRVK